MDKENNKGKEMKVNITPEMAKEMLEKNGHNRKMSNANVRKITDAMKAGKWAYNGEPIIIGEDGTLLDGQHRLMGIVKTGKAIHMEVVKDVKEICEYTGVNVFATIDIGKNRSAADIISIQDKEVNASAIVKIIKAMAVVATKTLKYGGSNGNRANLTNESILTKYLADQEVIQDLLEDSKDLATANQYDYMSFYDFAILKYALRKEPRAKADRFIRATSIFTKDLIEDGEECGAENENLCRILNKMYTKLSSFYEATGAGNTFNRVKYIAMFKAYHFYADDITTGFAITRNMDIIYPKSLQESTPPPLPTQTLTES